MSVHKRSLEVLCDESDCLARFEQDDMVESAGEARYFAIQAGWQSVSRDGVRRDYCPKHERPELRRNK